MPDAAPNKKLKITKVPLPDFFIALVLPDKHAHRQPSQKEVEALRDRTTEFWTTQMKETSFPKKFKKLDLKIEKTQFGTVSEEQADIEMASDLEPRFNMYVEFSGTIHFASRGSGVPSGNETFAEMTAGDSLEYLVEFVRGLSTDCVFADAVEVCARRLVIDPMADGGNVRAPTFFVAFGTEPWDDEAPKGPTTDEEVEVFRQKTYDHIDRNLKMAYPNTYEGSEMKVLMHECGTAKPDERFDIYTENDFKASFSSDPPTEAELFNVIMKCGGTDSTEYLQDMQKIKKSQFEDVTSVTVQIVGLELPEVEDLPPAPAPQESPEGEPPEEDEENVIERQVPIFLAVCTNTDPPSLEEVEEFDELMVRYFYTVVHKEYPDIVKNLYLKKLYTKFDEGIPEPRFNMCSEWNAVITFKPDSDPPDEKELNMLIIECNMSTILAYVRKLEPEPFKSTTEVTMRRHSQKPGPDDPIMDAKFEAAIDLPPTPELLEPPEDEAEKERERLEAEKERQRQEEEEERQRLEAERERERQEAEERRLEEEARKRAEKAKKKAEAEAKRKAEEEERQRREAAEQARAEEEARRLAEEEAKTAAEEAAKKKAREERLKKAAEAKAAKLEAEAKRKKEKKKKKEVPPPVDDGYESPEDDLPRVKTSDVFVALKLDHAENEPTKAEMEQLRKNTEVYFTERLKSKYPTTFASLRCQVGVMKWNSGYPKPEFNFYCEWDITAKFRDSTNLSSPMKTVAGTKQRAVYQDEAGGGDAPTSYELMRSLVVGANIIKYLTDAVRVVGGTFENGTAIYIKQREST